MPAALPAARITFVAPILPLPTFLGSAPLQFARSRPTGTEPSRYEPITHSNGQRHIVLPL